MHLANKASIRSIRTQISDHFPNRTYQDKVLVRIYEQALDERCPPGKREAGSPRQS